MLARAPRLVSSTTLRAFSSSPDHVARLIILGAPVLALSRLLGLQSSPEAQGSGKGTHQSRLKERFDLKTVNVGDLLRQTIRSGSELGNKLQKILARGDLVDDETVARIVEPEVLGKLRGSPWLIDGFPRKASQARILDELLDPVGESLNLVIYIDVADDLILQRIEDRWVHSPSGRTYNLSYSPPKEPGKDDLTGEPLSKREDDTAAVFSNRLKAFHAENKTLLEYYAEQDANRSSSQPPKLLTFAGETSDVIFPQILEAFESRFPSTPRIAR